LNLKLLFKYIPVSRYEVKTKKVKEEIARERAKKEEQEEGRKGEAKRQKKRSCCHGATRPYKKNSAATYSPTKSPWQYHRR
jgi:hypothetical protein